MKKGELITEKFALLKLLKLLAENSKNAQQVQKDNLSSHDENKTVVQATQSRDDVNNADDVHRHNYMADVLSKHETVANRLKRK